MVLRSKQDSDLGIRALSNVENVLNVSGWKAYQDDGRIWYYHESAKGKWWAHAGEEPKPYKEDL
eukprot:3322260-Amphidinium_carterae.2